MSICISFSMCGLIQNGRQRLNHLFFTTAPLWIISSVLLSISLSQSSLGVSLLYNLLYGYETYEVVQNPMFKSTSVSEFWGRRWNLSVHKGLKNGVYKPTLKYSSSKLLGALVTFVVSGIIHEYVNFVLFYRNDITGQFTSSWNQIMFFGWNGVLLALEHCISHWAIFKWMTRNLPQFVITALVLCCALPLAHLFTGDYIGKGIAAALCLHGWYFFCTFELVLQYNIFSAIRSYVSNLLQPFLGSKAHLFFGPRLFPLSLSSIIHNPEPAHIPLSRTWRASQASQRYYLNNCVRCQPLCH